MGVLYGTVHCPVWSVTSRNVQEDLPMLGCLFSIAVVAMLYLGVSDQVKRRGLQHHGSLPNLVTLPRHDVRQKVVDVLFDETPLQDLYSMRCPLNT